MKSNRLGLDFALLYINFVAAQDDGNIITHTSQITMPIGDVLVGDAGSNIKHDDAALALNIVAITESTKFLLSGSIPQLQLHSEALAELDETSVEVDADLRGGYCGESTVAFVLQSSTVGLSDRFVSVFSVF